MTATGTPNRGLARALAGLQGRDPGAPGSGGRARAIEAITANIARKANKPENPGKGPKKGRRLDLPDRFPRGAGTGGFVGPGGGGIVDPGIVDPRLSARNQHGHDARHDALAQMLTGMTGYPATQLSPGPAWSDEPSGQAGYGAPQEPQTPHIGHYGMGAWTQEDSDFSRKANQMYARTHPGQNGDITAQHDPASGGWYLMYPSGRRVPTPSTLRAIRRSPSA